MSDSPPLAGPRRPPGRWRRAVGRAGGLAAVLAATLAAAGWPGAGLPGAGSPGAGSAGRACADEAASRERLLSGLSGSDPDRRRAALAGLLAAARSDPRLGARALPALREVFRLRDPVERAPAARALLALAGPEPLELWQKVLFEPDPDERVLGAALEGAVERAGDPALARLLVERSGDGRALPEVRGLALEALGVVGGPAARVRLALPRLGAEWVEESGRALGLLRLGERGGVPPLLALLGHGDLCVRVSAWEALTGLTGARLPVERGAWEAWWAARGTAAAPAKPVAPSPAPGPVGDRYAPVESLHEARFYGLPLRRRGASRAVAFCLDVSQSMYGPPLDRSRRELEQTLKSLTSEDRFEVVAFNENALPFASRLVRAHPVVKARAIEWFRTLEPTSYTNLFDALELAYGLCGRGRRAVKEPGRLDAIYLLSDGAPNRGRLWQPAPIVKAVTELSRPDLPVHTIGVGEAAFDLLRQIAAATGGTFLDAFE